MDSNNCRKFIVRVYSYESTVNYREDIGSGVSPFEAAFLKKWEGKLVKIWTPMDNLHIPWGTGHKGQMVWCNQSKEVMCIDLFEII
jgi:hypothetical protein